MMHNDCSLACLRPVSIDVLYLAFFAWYQDGLVKICHVICASFARASPTSNSYFESISRTDWCQGGGGTVPDSLMWCRWCPALDLLPKRCQGQNGTGAAPPSLSDDQEVRWAGCGWCQLSSVAHFSNCDGAWTKLSVQSFVYCGDD